VEQQKGLRPLRPTTGPAAGGRAAIDIETLGRGAISPGLNAPKERILLAGDTNSGKSYAYMQIARRIQPQGKRMWIIDTDDTAPMFLAPGYEFEDLYYENGGNVYPFYAGDWPTIVKAANYIIKHSENGDWVVIDLASTAYALAQQYIAELKGLNLNDEVANRLGVLPGQKKMGFGAFDADTWALVTRTYEATMRPLVNSPKLNFIGLAHVTEMMTKAGRESREPILLFDQLGLKPTGVGKLVRMVNTCVVLWSVRPLDANKESSPKISRLMTVVKDRGEACYYTEPFTEFYEDLKRYRKEVAKTVNVTDREEAAQMLEQAREQFRSFVQEEPEPTVEEPADAGED
jgi:hypothetical protein